MSWITPLLPQPEKIRTQHRRAERNLYHREWRAENRERLLKYWRRYYRQKHEARRAYLNKKQREYRAAKKDKA